MRFTIGLVAILALVSQVSANGKTQNHGYKNEWSKKEGKEMHRMTNEHRAAHGK